MAITYTRVYDRAMVVVSSEELSDVVTSIYCIATGSDENGVSLTIGEDIVLDPPESTNFIPFDQLTKETIDGWVTTKEQYKILELKIEQGIGGMIAPAIVSKSLNLEPVIEVTTVNVGQETVITPEQIIEVSNTEIGIANGDATSI